MLLRSLLLLVTGSALFADTFYVCSSGSMEDGQACTHKTLQAALDAAPDGSTIIMRSGDTSPHVFIPRGRHDITFKSSQIDNYPRGYRITRGHPALAKIQAVGARAAVHIGEEFAFGTPQTGTDLLRVPSGHGMTVGTRVTLETRRFSPYYCEKTGIEPFGIAQCPEDKVGFLMIRGTSYLADGNVVYFRAPVLPQPLQQDTPYYVVNFVKGIGSNESPDKFQVAAAPGGTPITLTGYTSAGGLVMEAGMAPFRASDQAWVVATPTPTSVKLAQSEGGEPVTFTQASLGYNGGGFVPGNALVKASAVQNIVFDGFEITNDPDRDAYHLMYIPATSSHVDGEHSGIRILRCWLHPDDDQDSLPHQGVYLGARDSEVGWSIVEGIWSNFADTQAVAIVSRGNVWIHDNLLSSTGECIMSGGNFPAFFPDLTRNLRIERNYFYKPLTWWSSIQFTPVDDVTFRLVSRNVGKTCSSTASDKALSNRCFWYEGTDLPVSSWQRHELRQDYQIGLSGVTSSGRIILYAQAGTLHIRHNLEGTLSCPAEIECVKEDKPAFPPGSTRLSGTVVNRGKIDPASWWVDNRPPWVKNSLESKYGDEWQIEGNVFHRQFMTPGNVISQDTLIQFTVAANGSSDVDAVNYTVSSSNSFFRNNIFRHSGMGITGNGQTFSPSGAYARREMTGLGKVNNNKVENNLFVDIGSSEWTNTARGAPFLTQLNADWLWAHNTAIDVRQSQIGIKKNKNIDVHSNIFVPYDSRTHPGAQNFIRNFPEVTGDGITGWVPAMDSSSIYQFLEGDSRFDNNILLNRNAWANSTARPTWYPNSTYLNDLQKDKIPDPSELFAKWMTRPQDDWTGAYYREGNFRMRSSEARKYRARDERTIGADIDEIEALTGPFGKDVEEGIPPFFKRSERQVTRISDTGASISYMPLTPDPCSIQAWDNNAYAGNPIVDTTDTDAEIWNSHKVVTTNKLKPGVIYFGKRICGTSVDVFTIPAPKTP